MSNAVHVYVSQAHKGELVMGAGVDSYNGYGQRGAFHIIERQMAAAVELFPVFARAHLLRTWAGIVDVCPDASPIVGRTALREPVPQRGMGHRRIQGHAGAGLVPGRHDRQRRGARRTSSRSASTDSSPARWSTSTAPPASRTETRTSPSEYRSDTMQLIECPWCGPREETEFHYGGEAHVAYPADPAGADRRAVGALRVLPQTTPRGSSPSGGPTAPAAAAGSTPSVTPRPTDSTVCTARTSRSRRSR